MNVPDGENRALSGLGETQDKERYLQYLRESEYKPCGRSYGVIDAFFELAVFSVATPVRLFC